MGDDDARPKHPYRDLAAFHERVRRSPQRRDLREIRKFTRILRGACDHGLLASEPRDELAYMLGGLSEYCDEILDEMRSWKTKATAATGILALLSGAALRLVGPPWGGSLFSVLLGAAVGIAVTAVVTDRWVHVLERFDRAIQDARRVAQTLPIPERTRVEADTGGRAEADVEFESVRTSHIERKGTR